MRKSYKDYALCILCRLHPRSQTASLFAPLIAPKPLQFAAWGYPGDHSHASHPTPHPAGALRSRAARNPCLTYSDYVNLSPTLHWILKAAIIIVFGIIFGLYPQLFLYAAILSASATLALITWDISHIKHSP